MHFQPAFDMSWGPALVLVGMFAFPFIVVWTLLSESVALYWFKFHRSFWRCVGNAVLVNVVSGAVGIFWTFVLLDMEAFFFWVNGLVGSPPIDNYQTLSPVTEFWGIIILLLISWVGSILLEFLVLMGLRFVQWSSLTEEEQADPQPIWQQALEISLLINTVSYAGMFIAMILFWL